ncbi:hypothetical protein V1515DRAFT_596454 [Lipomyces mesembrius]
MLVRKKPCLWVLLVFVALSLACFYSLHAFAFVTSTSFSLPFHSHSSPSPNTLPTLIVFGDSWSDDATRPSPADRAAHVDGDKFYAAESRDGRRPRRFGAGFGGRWSDGPVWPEYLCEAAGCADYLNLAFGGAKVTNKFVTSPVPDLVEQRDQFLAIKEADYSAMDRYSPTDELTDNRRTLFIFWFGINDLIQYSSMLPTPVDRKRAVVSSVATLFDVATDIAGRFPQSNFLFMSAVDVTLLPIWHKRFMANDFQLRKYKEVVGLSKAWRQEMTMHVGNWNHSLGSIQYWDANAWYARSISGVANNGFENLKDQCFDHDTGTLCPKPNKYFFWDYVHLTTAAHKAIATRLSHMNLWPAMTQYSESI